MGAPRREGVKCKSKFMNERKKKPDRLSHKSCPINGGDRVPFLSCFLIDLLVLGGSNKDLVWCGVVWCGVVWCGVVWCGVGGSI